jgi:exonuclease VII large subunit
MLEDTTPTASQEDASGMNPVSQADTTTSTPSQADESHNKPSKTAEDYERMIAELRKENASHRTKLKKFEEEEAKRVEAQLSKEQLLEKQYNELKTEHESFVEAQFEQMIEHEMGLAAAELGVSPKHLKRVARLIDWEEIDINDDGIATNIQDLVASLVKDMPELLGKSAPTSGGATNPSRSQSSAPQALSWQVIGKMTPAEYEARRSEIQQWMVNNPPRFR